MIHPDPHPQAGQTVTLRSQTPALDGAEFRLEDWWDRVTGGSWMDAEGNPAALGYAMRSAFACLPTDNEVVYGKVGPFGHLVHASELASVPERSSSESTEARR